jgi:ketosteroid isomerase-like protein
MSAENIELVRQIYERAAQGDFDWIDQLPDEFVFVTSPDVPDAGAYRGQQAKEWTKNWIHSFEGMTMEAGEITDAGDKVFLEIRQRGRAGGSETDIQGRWWQVISFRDGLPVRSELYPDRGKALEAAGLAD